VLGVALVFVPALIVAVPLLLPTCSARRRYAIVAGALSVIMSLLAILSVGWFYLPAAILLLAAGAIWPSTRERGLLGYSPDGHSS
jgi:predicted branched-subunit amino acid permease